MKEENKNNIMMINDMEESFPIYVSSNFLGQKENKKVFSDLCKSEQCFFSPSDKITTKHLSIRDTSSIEMQNISNILSSHVTNVLTNIFESLNIKAFSNAKLNFNFIHGLDGHYGSAHSDEYGRGYKITLLYYLHNETKNFKGGDLQFYDSLNQEKILKEIDFENDLFIAFPSNKFHGVSKVLSNSNLFEDGRFVAVCFVREE